MRHVAFFSLTSQFICNWWKLVWEFPCQCCFSNSTHCQFNRLRECTIIYIIQIFAFIHALDQLYKGQRWQKISVSFFIPNYLCVLDTLTLLEQDRQKSHKEREGRSDYDGCCCDTMMEYVRNRKYHECIFIRRWPRTLFLLHNKEFVSFFSMFIFVRIFFEGNFAF